MDETLSHPPPCLCCRSVGEEGPHLARRWNTAFEHDGYVDLFQEGISQPRGWIHRSCLCEFVLHNATRTADGETKIDKICASCAKCGCAPPKLCQLWGQHTKIPLAWVHVDCMKVSGGQ
jgi:hypothetical protein